jgi:hypothetical protein
VLDRLRRERILGEVVGQHRAVRHGLDVEEEEAAVGHPVSVRKTPAKERSEMPALLP